MFEHIKNIIINIFNYLSAQVNDIVGQSFLSKIIAIVIIASAGYLLFKFIKTSVKIFLYLFIALAIIGAGLFLYKTYF
ncbi:hypothetical protein CL633_02910 [bacterium]|nr:hypothetical protein [bacterium]|tara:strand:+ start:1766 stop:1999 length:234 start_codon:yes stop_codon:yes gene_type:complete